MSDALNQYHLQFNTYLQEQYFRNTPHELYEPVNYILSLGGKRIRPMLLLVGCDVFGGRINDAMPAAFAIEMFHNFSLMHDDIMDNAPLRRGKSAVHEKYNINTAILSGDVMMIWCYKYLQKISSEKFANIFQAFNNMAIKICEGQQMDMNFEKRLDVAEQEYLKMIENKTSVLLASCLKMGAIIGNASETETEKMYQLGLNLGIAFQLKDDLLDAFGDQQEVGKERGGDIINNKKTLLLINALESVEDDNKEKLLSLLSSSEENKVNKMLDLFIKSGAKQYVESKADFYNHEAFRVIELLQIPSKKKELLTAFAENLLNRKY
jgi:geranylgeranyl diphosphate synthase, type II